MVAKKSKMGPPKNNKNGLKLKEPDVRQEAYEKYCEWLAMGKSSRSFTFKKGDLMCVGRTMESYIRDNPLEFPPLKKELAYCQGYAIWEQVVEESAKGINKDASTASLQMLMRNKYNWDKEDKDPVYRHETDMDKMIAKWETSGSKPEAARQPEQLECED